MKTVDPKTMKLTKTPKWIKDHKHSQFLTYVFKFAERKHREIGHVRKKSNAPYIIHPIAVAKKVDSVTTDYHMVAAALLHDTVEDTNTTLVEIEENFGTDIMELVEGLTDISKPEDGNRAERKRIDREHTAESSSRVHTIKLADLIDNTKDITKNDEKFANTYMKEKRLIHPLLKDGNIKLWKEADKQLSEWENA